MSAPSLLVPFAELEREDEVTREWELSPRWLAWAFEGTEATSPTPGHLEATLSRNGREVLVRGRIVLQSSSRRLLDEPQALEDALTVQQTVAST